MRVSPFALALARFLLQFPDSTLPVATRVSELRRVESPARPYDTDAAADMAAGCENSSEGAAKGTLMDLNS